MFVFCHNCAILCRQKPACVSDLNQRSRTGLVKSNPAPISNVQNYLWPHFGKEKSRLIFIDNEEDYLLSYLIPIAKLAKVRADKCDDSILIVTESSERANQ